MVHTFLPGMIERRNGRIVSISSAVAISTIPCSIIYASAKWGLSGFMTSLADDLSANDYESFIKLTTVYPDFTCTRKELIDSLDEINMPLPRMTPEYVADETVCAVLKNKRKIIISELKFLLILFGLVPTKFDLEDCF